MKSIKEPFKTVEKLLGAQEVVLGEEYRPLSFVTFAEVDGHAAVYNSLTGELLLLDEEEVTLFKTNSTVVADESCTELIEKWFLVNIDHDDMQLRNELLDFFNVFRHDKKIAGYTILPTSDCNARCFYCFELGHKHLHMTDKIAHDTVDFILKSGEKKVRLKWFGGEPLYNDRAIDIITSGLRNAGVEFSSSMITNAYLFNDERVKKAVEDWKIKSVQITLDGTEEVYNRIKAYIYRDGESAFKIVMDNIERLLKVGIRVSIRLNLDNKNFEDLMDLVDILHDRFGNYKKFGAYSYRLFELSDRPDSLRTDIERMELDAKWMALEAKLGKYGLLSVKKLPSRFKANRCMADSNVSAMVLPDGHLGKCEHHIDTNFIGDIYNGITDFERVNRFCERIDSADICRGCKVYPACVSLKDCSSLKASGICDEAFRNHEEKQLYESVKRYVENYLSKQQ